MKQRHTIIDLFTEHIGEHNIYPHSGALSPLYCLLPWYGPTVKDIPSTKFPIFFINKKDQTKMIIDDDHYRQASSKALRLFLDGAFSISEVKSKLLSYFSQIRGWYGYYIFEDFSKWTESEIIEHYQKLFSYYHHMVGSTLFIESLDKKMAKELAGGQIDIEKIWPHATQPYFESFEKRRKKYIDSLIETESNIEKVAKQSMYIFTDYYKPQIFDEVVLSIQEGQYFEHIDDTETKKDFSQEDWFLSLSKKEKELVEYIQFVMEMRDIRKDPIAQAQYVMYLFSRELAHRAGIDELYVVHITPLEYLHGVSWLKEHKDFIEQRYHGFIGLLMDDGETLHTDVCHYDNTVRDFFDIFQSKNEEKVLHGNIAHKGLVRGRVKIIYQEEKTNNFQDGDILVTSMTRPEIMPLMKKAVAIVTDEGGITSHAAIVSRELGIPCIIGTKFATQILNDGDLIEVDAHRGIIKILERKDKSL